MATNNEQREPAIITIFGISGDLAKRKLLPALYSLVKNGLLADHTYIVGISRKSLEVQTLLDRLTEQLQSEDIEVDHAIISWLKDRLSMHIMNIDEPNDYTALKSTLDSTEERAGTCLNRVFYLAVPATASGNIVGHLGDAGLNKGCQHGAMESRLLIEKPFGYDLASAKDLIDEILESFAESETYRIDHYLAKETVQNILILRSQNPLLEAAWGRKYIKSITIRAYEAIGIENRVDFYEETGAFRDVIQSHLLQLLGLVTMELPINTSAEAIHAAKEAVLREVLPPNHDEMTSKTVRGQYKDYDLEVGAIGSQTETYALAEFHIDSRRWQGVPMILETGKAMNQKQTEIIIEFKSKNKQEHASNVLTMKLQPNEGIVLDVRIKKPGFAYATETVPIDFYYRERQDLLEHPDAYERVIADAINGDRTLFATSEEVLECWRASQAILDAWKSDNVPLKVYEKGANSIH